MQSMPLLSQHAHNHLVAIPASLHVTATAGQPNRSQQERTMQWAPGRAGRGWKHLGGDDALLGVEVGGGLVDEVDVGGRAQRQHERDALQLAAAEVAHLLVQQRLDAQRLHHVRVELRVQEGVPHALVQQLPHLHQQPPPHAEARSCPPPAQQQHHHQQLALTLI